MRSTISSLAIICLYIALCPACFEGSNGPTNITSAGAHATGSEESGEGDGTSSEEDESSENESSGDESTEDEGACGDGTIDEGEECDAGAENGPGSDCTSQCTVNMCGDGELGPDEQCDDGNDSEFDGCTTACGESESPTLELTGSPVKHFDFSWSPVFGADYYRLLERVGDGAPYVPVGGELVGVEKSLTVPLHLQAHASYILRACREGEGCVDSEEVYAPSALVDAIGYFKASNSGSGDIYGLGVAISGDGSTLAVSAGQEDSGATGVGGDQSDNSKGLAGAIYIYERDEQGGWSQQAYMKASNTDANDYFGWRLALSEDGNTLVAGAYGEDSNATGIGGDQSNESMSVAGAAYVFVRGGQGGWVQQAYVKASNTGAGDHFGLGVALSADGNTMAVGANREDSGSMGIGGSQIDNSATNSGAVYIFVRNQQEVWSQQAYVKASNAGANDYFGSQLVLSGDGHILAVAAHGEDGGMGGNPDDDSVNDSGAVYVFERDGQGAWSERGYLKSPTPGDSDLFGNSLAMDMEGTTIAVGCYKDDSGAMGVGGNPLDNSAPDAGSVYVFVRNGQGVWAQQSYIKPSSPDAGDLFGFRVALSADGNMLAASSSMEDGSGSGLTASPNDNTATDAGAAYVFERDGQGAWSERVYVKASNTQANDWYGRGLALSSDGLTLAVGAIYEDSGATGVGGDQEDNSVSASGAVYIY